MYLAEETLYTVTDIKNIKYYITSVSLRYIQKHRSTKTNFIGRINNDDKNTMVRGDYENETFKNDTTSIIYDLEKDPCTAHSCEYCKAWTLDSNYNHENHILTHPELDIDGFIKYKNSNGKTNTFYNNNEKIFLPYVTTREGYDRECDICSADTSTDSRPYPNKKLHSEAFRTEFDNWEKNKNIYGKFYTDNENFIKGIKWRSNCRGHTCGYCKTYLETGYVSHEDKNGVTRYPTHYADDHNKDPAHPKTWFGKAVNLDTLNIHDTLHKELYVRR
jgi:hypothetical protein